MKFVYIEVYKTGNNYTLVISDKHGGYRIAGVKPNLNSKLVKRFKVSSIELNNAIKANEFLEEEL